MGIERAHTDPIAFVIPKNAILLLEEAHWRAARSVISFFLERKLLLVHKLSSSEQVMGRPREVTDEEILVAARRCFLKHGAGVSAADIASELGVSHTTLFNRFGSKDALMIAALGPPKDIPWIAALEVGPDNRPIREQLVEHAQVMAAYFQDLQAGLGLLQAAGIDPSKAYRGRKGDSPPVQAFRALVAWLQRAQKMGRLGRCDVETLASTMLAALHGWAFTARVCGESTAPAVRERYTERFVELLWSGIGADKRDR